MEFRYDRIRELREKHNYSLSVAVRLLKSRAGFRLSRGGFSMWETGRMLPSLPGLMALSELYGVDPGYFFEPRTS